MTMPDATKPRKPNRFWLFAPYGLVLIALAGWSAYWLSMRGRIEAALSEAAKPGPRQALSFSSHSIGGFPFRFEVTLREARFSEASGWAVAAPRLDVEVAAYDLNHLVIVAPQGLTLTRPNKGAVAVAGEALRASVAGLNNQPRVSIEATKLTVNPVAGGEPLPFGAADKFEAHLRPEAGDKSRFYLGLTNATATPNTPFARLSDGKTNLKLEAELSHASALKGGSWPAVLQSWSAAGGDMVIARADASVGGVTLSTEKSGLAVDADGRLRGKLDLRLSEGSTGMMALGATGVLPPETAAVGAGLAGSGAHFTLKFKNGETLVGPLPIGKAPRIY